VSWVRLQQRQGADEDPYLLEQVERFMGDYIEKGHHDDKLYYVRKGANNQNTYIFWSSNMDGTGGWYLNSELGVAWTLSELWSLEATQSAPRTGWMMRGKWGYEVEAPIHVELGVHYKKPSGWSCFGETRKTTVRSTMTFDQTIANELAWEVPILTALRDETKWFLGGSMKPRSISMKQRASNSVDKAQDEVYDFFCMEMGCIVPLADALGDWFSSTFNYLLDGVFACASGTDRMKVQAMHATMSNRDIVRQVSKSWRKVGYNNTRVWWVEMGCDVPFAVALEDWSHQVVPAFKAIYEDMGCNVGVKSAMVDLYTTFVKDTHEACVLVCRRGLGSLMLRFKALVPKRKPKTRELKVESLEVPTGLGVDREFNVREDLRNMFMFQPGVKPHMKGVDAIDVQLIEDDMLCSDPYVYGSAAQLAGIYWEHLSPFEGKMYYQRVEEENRRTMYIYWGPAWKTEGAWFLADKIGGKWICYNESQSRAVPLEGWKIRNKVAKNVEVPLRFDMKSFSTEIRDATEEIASKVGMEAYLADMACDVPFREAIRDLRQHSECYEGLLAFVGMVGDCFDQIFRMPEDDDEKQPLLKEMALKVSMKDARG